MPVELRRATTHAGAQIMEKQSEIGQLIEALYDARYRGDGAAQRRASERLGEYGPAARQAVPALLATMDDQPDNDVSDAAWDALMKIGTVAIPDLVRIILDEEMDERRRFLAADTLGDL